MLPHKRLISLEFFNRPAAAVARDLLGRTLVRSVGGQASSFIVTETEAYEGEHDLACHSAKGRTRRTEVLFGPAGRFYVYRIYGLHWMLNVVTGETGEGAGVLIRGLEGINGPGRVAAALAVDAALNGKEATPASSLWFEAPEEPRTFKILRKRRVGVDYAGPIWSSKKLRFLME